METRRGIFEKAGDISQSNGEDMISPIPMNEPVLVLDNSWCLDQPYSATTPDANMAMISYDN